MKSRPIPKSILRQRPSFNEPESKGKELSLGAVVWSVIAIFCLVGITAIGLVGWSDELTGSPVKELFVFFCVTGVFALTYIRRWWNSH